MSTILVTGGLGYKGSVLVPKLLKEGYKVIVLDPGWFGNYLTPNKNLKIFERDILDIKIDEIKNVDVAILLHSVANDPCSDLAPTLTWETACFKTEFILRSLKKTSCSKVIYASSASVYGIRKEENIVETLEPVAVSVYNKTKVVAERIVLSFDEFKPTIIRPATVCGLSPRMRLDTVVNMLTVQAISRKVITVLGGAQYRPNVHIDDLINSYLFFLNNLSLKGIYNVGNDTRKVLDIANAIREKLDCKVEIKESNDPRSYRLNTQKIIKEGFCYQKNIENAIDEIIIAYQSGNLEDQDKWYNIRWMKTNVLKN